MDASLALLNRMMWMPLASIPSEPFSLQTCFVVYSLAPTVNHCIVSAAIGMFEESKQVYKWLISIPAKDREGFQHRSASVLILRIVLVYSLEHTAADIGAQVIRPGISGEAGLPGFIRHLACNIYRYLTNPG